MKAIWSMTKEERKAMDSEIRRRCVEICNQFGKDEESGLPHLWHIACNVAFLCELQKEV